jgi:hypothetical protein
LHELGHTRRSLGRLAPRGAFALREVTATGEPAFIGRRQIDLDN